jgi:hypothetical protein
MGGIFRGIFPIIGVEKMKPEFIALAASAEVSYTNRRAFGLTSEKASSARTGFDEKMVVDT